MDLQYPPEWKIEGVGFGIPKKAVDAFETFLLETTSPSHGLVEAFKTQFGGSGYSSSSSWARSDFSDLLSHSGDNAALFVANLWECTKLGLEESKGWNEKTKNALARKFNTILAEHKIPLRVEPPQLVLADAVVNDNPSPDQKTHALSFELGDLIGQGSYGRVYQASRRTSMAVFNYAVKVLDPSAFIVDPEKAKTRFRREIQAVQKLDHRAIIRHIDAGQQSDGKLYLVMPFIQGPNIRDAAQTMSHNQRILLFREVLSALEYAHAEDVLHRDLKPSNILVRQSDGQPIILDFGAAFIFGALDSKTLTDSALGTPGYIPQEVLIEPKRRTKGHDIYSAGITLYEIFAQRLPNPQNYIPLAEQDVQLQPLDEVIKKAIASEHARFPSMRDFREALDNIVDPSTIVARPSVAPPQKLDLAEIFILAVLAEETMVPNVAFSKYSAEKACDKYLSRLMIQLSLGKLHRLKYIEFFSAHNSSDEEYTAVKLSDAGREWVLEHSSYVTRVHSATIRTGDISVFDDDDIPF